MDAVEKLILLEALKNAVKYGEAREKVIFGKLMKDPENRKNIPALKLKVGEILKEVNSWDKEIQEKKLLELAPQALEQKKKAPEKKVLPDLPNVKKGKQVVMRLAPYPSGALHIGNARMLVLNDEYVKRYKGKLVLVFDDTIGATKNAMETNPGAKYVIPEAYDLIREGLDWLGIKYDKNNVVYKSDRLDIYQNYNTTL